MARVVKREDGEWKVREDVPVVRKLNRTERRRVARMRGGRDARTRKLIEQALKGSDG